MTSESFRLTQLEKRVAKLEEIVTQLAVEQGLPVDLDDDQGDVDSEIVALLQQRKKIEAVKRYRESSGVGLREAKEYVEAIEKRIKRGEY